MKSNLFHFLLLLFLFFSFFFLFPNTLDLWKKINIIIHSLARASTTHNFYVWRIKSVEKRVTTKDKEQISNKFKEYLKAE